MKSTGTIEAGTGLWYAPNQDATNSSGFTAFPGGIRTLVVSFGNSIGVSGVWWSSTESSSSKAWRRHLSLFSAVSGWDNDYKANGSSVRCLQD